MPIDHSAMNAVLFAEHGTAATYTPLSGSPLSVKAIVEHGVDYAPDGTLTATQVAGTAWRIIGMPYMIGRGKVGTTTGFGNADLLVSSDGLHPSYPEGQDALGYALASTLINALGLNT